MKLPIIDSIVPKSKVILRIDADLPMKDGLILDNARLIKSIPTIEKLLKKGCKIAIIGHLGRPAAAEALAGKPDKKFSLKPIYIELMTLLDKVEESDKHLYLENFEDRELIKKSYEENNIIFFENLRFWNGEETNDPTFLLGLVGESNVFVNDAFAVAHRVCASVMLHKFLPTFYGISFVEEVEKIGKAIENPERPFVIALGGAKADKLRYVRELSEIADYVLIGGKLPDLIDTDLYRFIGENPKIIIGNFDATGFDLDEATIRKFTEIISYSKTIIWAGAMGLYEIEAGQKGTNEIAAAVAKSSAYKIIAGGDTLASIVSLGLKNKIDFMCSGAGVMLEYLTKKTLPAWRQINKP